MVGKRREHAYDDDDDVPLSCKAPSSLCSSSHFSICPRGRDDKRTSMHAVCVWFYRKAMLSWDHQYLNRKSFEDLSLFLLSTQRCKWMPADFFLLQHDKSRHCYVASAGNVTRRTWPLFCHLEKRREKCDVCAKGEKRDLSRGTKEPYVI